MENETENGNKFSIYHELGVQITEGRDSLEKEVSEVIMKKKKIDAALEELRRLASSIGSRINEETGEITKIQENEN